MTEQQIDVHMLHNFIHQVVNPLNGVVGTLDNIIDGTARGNREQRLKAIRAQLEHSIQLIRNMAYLSQMGIPDELRKLKEGRQRCVIPELIIQAAQFYQDSGKVGIDLEDSKTQYVVYGHRDLLRQVFLNLFDNATKYADKDSVVHVRTRIQKGTNHLIVEVENSGFGFDNADRTALFGLGYRSLQAQEKTAAGSGIGLHICKRILEDVFDSTIEAEHDVKHRLTSFRMRFTNAKIEDTR